MNFEPQYRTQSLTQKEYRRAIKSKWRRLRFCARIRSAYRSIGAKAVVELHTTPDRNNYRG